MRKKKKILLSLKRERTLLLYAPYKFSTMRLCTLGSLKSRSICAFVRLLLPCNSSSSSSSSAKIRAVRNLSSIREDCGADFPSVPEGFDLRARRRRPIVIILSSSSSSRWSEVYNAQNTEREREREKAKETLCRFLDRFDLSILFTKTSEKKAEKKRRLFFTEREGTVPHFSHPQKKQHIYQRERERFRERSKEGPERRVLLCVIRYKSDVRKFFFFFARQRGESKLERDSEMVRRWRPVSYTHLKLPTNREV